MLVAVRFQIHQHAHGTEFDHVFGHVVCLFQRLNGQRGSIEGDDLFSGKVVDRAYAHVLQERVQMRLVGDVVERIERRIFTDTSVEVGTFQPRDGSGNVRIDSLGDLGTYLQSDLQSVQRQGNKERVLLVLGEDIVGVRRRYCWCLEWYRFSEDERQMRLDDISAESHLRITTLLFRGGHDDGHPLCVQTRSTSTSDHLNHVTATHHASRYRCL